ncbi:MAG: hypothetical protein GY828_00170, partial [Candidatus Gracilibacteria bacterium]|nr:hypothetical protein [Candidatus Gracilibacteria bacterium]
MKTLQKRIWRSGWGSSSDQYRNILEQIKVGDRFAIKKILGPSDPSRIKIQAIG